MKISDNQMKLD